MFVFFNYKKCIVISVMCERKKPTQGFIFILGIFYKIMKYMLLKSDYKDNKLLSNIRRKKSSLFPLTSPKKK